MWGNTYAEGCFEKSENEAGHDGGISLTFFSWIYFSLLTSKLCGSDCITRLSTHSTFICVLLLSVLVLFVPSRIFLVLDIITKTIHVHDTMEAVKQ